MKALAALLARLFGSKGSDLAAKGSDLTPNLAEFVARWEGFEPSPYLCPAKKPTIGHGTTVYPDGRPVTLADKPCTRKQALEWLAHDLAEAEAAVKTYVTAPISQAQRVALVSFIYNVGVNAFARSTLARLLNRRDYEGAKAEFAKWINAGGRPLTGLVRRRAAEAELFGRAP